MDRRNCQPINRPTDNYRLYFEQCICCQKSCKTKQESTHGFCHDCLADLPWLLDHCPLCALPQDHQLMCDECANQKPLYDTVTTPFRYAFPIAELIYSAKEKSRPLYIHALTRQLSLSLLYVPLPECLLAVPMHPKDFRLRGFNQADLMAQQLSQRLNLTYRPQLLIKHSRTEKQHTLSRQSRRLNLARSFEVDDAIANYTHIALIDDVMTTGETINALCRALLKKNKRLKIDVWVLARTANTQEA